MLKTFDCSLYASTCSGVSGYEAYQNCAATVAVNNANDMACRTQHLMLAATDANTHCPHAQPNQPNPAAPCSNEMLKTFDCSLYASTCSGVSGYEAYSDCQGTVSANGANGMACRIQHLQLAVSNAATHCPHAQPNATGPCSSETLLPPLTTTMHTTTTGGGTGSDASNSPLAKSLGAACVTMLCVVIFAFH